MQSASAASPTLGILGSLISKLLSCTPLGGSAIASSVCRAVVPSSRMVGVRRVDWMLSSRLWRPDALSILVPLPFHASNNAGSSQSFSHTALARRSTERGWKSRSARS